MAWKPIDATALNLIECQMADLLKPQNGQTVAAHQTGNGRPLVPDVSALPLFLNTAQAAALCNFTTAKMRSLVERRLIPYCRPAGTRELRFEKTQLLEWLSSQTMADCNEVNNA